MVSPSSITPQELTVWEDKRRRKYYYKAYFGSWGIRIGESKYKYTNLKSFIKYAKSVVKKKIEDKYGNTK